MPRWVRTALAVVLVALMAGGTWGCKARQPGPGPEPAPPPPPADEPAGLPPPAIPAAGVVLTPARADRTGADPTAGFWLASAEPLPPEQVERALTVQPAAELRYHQADPEGRLYAVRTARPLEPNQVYTFRLAAGGGVDRPYQWAIQTRAEFRILGSLPRHQATGVPPETGIELAFSHEGYDDPAPFFRIEPVVAGRWERHKRVAVFVPGQPLAPGTLYTVTVAAGLPLDGTGRTLTQPYTFSFETDVAAGNGGSAPVEFYAPTELLDFPTGELPYLQVHYFRGDILVQEPVAVTVYRYRDADQLIPALEAVHQVPWWVQQAALRHREPTIGLQRVARFEAALQKVAGHWGGFLFFPSALPAGYYLAELAADDQVRQVRFQVTDLATYLSVTSTRSLAWVNDLQRKGPAAGAEVTYPGGTASTGDDGLAAFPTPEGLTGEEETGGLYLRVRARGKEAVVAVRATGRPMAMAAPEIDIWGIPAPRPAMPGYWKYLYVDRPMYRPGDTVRFFGVIHPREAGAAPVDQVTATLLRGDRWGFRGEWGGGRSSAAPPLARVERPVTGGSFSGAVALPNLPPGSYELRIFSGRQYVTSRWIQVEAYTKPAYRLTATADRRAVFAGEPVQFKVEAAFFEGTPVPDLPLTYSITWAGGRDETAVTGADGSVTIPFRPASTDSQPRWGGPDRAWLSVRATLPEAGEINAGTELLVFTRNVALWPEVKVEAGVARIEAVVRHVSLEQLNAGEGWDYQGAPAAGLRVEGVLVEENWVQVPAGEHYDFIQKRVVQDYEYRYEPREAGRFSAVTDAVGRVEHRVNVDPGKHYRVRLQVLDTNGLPVEHESHFSGSDTLPRGPRSYGPYRYYHLAPADREQQSWAEGEEVVLHLLENEETLPDRPAGFLFYQARLVLGQYRVQDSATYRFPFRAADVPNTTVRGVWFDGRQYQEAWDYNVRFNPAERELQVTVTPERPAYRPGEMVELAVQVADRTGRPVPAQVNLSLVDEALLALREHRADILAELYGEHIPSGILYTRRTHAALPEGRWDDAVGMLRAPAVAGQPAMAQGEAPPADTAAGGAPVRHEFLDTAYFTSVATDAAGQTRVRFRLPDNLTTWRVTYQAFAPGTAGAATGTAPLVVKIPFFVDAVLSSTYLAGDRPVLTVRSFGADLPRGATVQYEVTVTGPGGSRSLTAHGRAFSPVSLPLGPLQAGAYRVLVRGGGPGGLADALELPFAAAASYLRQPRLEFSLLGDDTRVTGAAGGLTTLTLTDYHRGRWLQFLHRLRWQGGSRLEQHLARQVAAGLLATHFDLPGPGGAPQWEPLAYQSPDGSVAILPWSGGDLYLSALVADLAPELFDQARLADHFEQVLEDEGAGRERAITALYGLAALQRPVLAQVAALLREPDLTPAEQLLLAMAAAALGDLEGARPVYRALWERHGELLGANARLAVGRDQDETLTATAQAVALGARLGEPEVTAMLGYLLDNPTREVLLLLEPLLAAQAALPRLPQEPVAFTYVLAGEEKRVELQPGETLRWELPAAALAGLRFRDVRGQVGLTVAYDAPLAAGQLRQEPGFSVQRTYTVEGGGKWQRGALVRVSLAYGIPETAPGGGYELTDYLPAGLRLVQRPWQHGMEVDWRHGPAWPVAVEGHRVTFWAWRDGGPLFYYARVVSPGEYTAEQPVLQHQDSGVIYAHGERARVRVD